MGEKRWIHFVYRGGWEPLEGTVASVCVVAREMTEYWVLYSDIEYYYEYIYLLILMILHLQNIYKMDALKFMLVQEKIFWDMQFRGH